ncbi:transcription regulator HTH, apses-type DNA-binding domain-containing protein, partial [Rhodotorula diobovata]
RNPIVSCTLWEDERTVVMQVLIEGHVVARRADNDWVNSTKLLNMVVGMTRGKRDMYLKASLLNEPERIVFRRGALHLKGVWIPLPAAVELANNYGLTDFLYPLFEPNIRSFL